MPLHVEVTWFPKSAGTAKQVTLDAEATVADLLETLDVTPDSVLVVRAGVPIPLDAPLSDGDAVRVVYTVSGG